MKINKKDSGFTFMELMISVVIIITLSTIAIVYYQSAQKKARDNKRKSDLEQIRAALEMYRSENGSYPSGGGWSNMVSELQPDFMKEAPEDPRSDSYEYYYSSATGDSYSLCAYFETGGSDSCGDCEVGSGTTACNYEVTNP